MKTKLLTFSLNIFHILVKTIHCIFLILKIDFKNLENFYFLVIIKLILELPKPLKTIYFIQIIQFLFIRVKYCLVVESKSCEFNH